jgi:hypothetical protein
LSEQTDRFACKVETPEKPGWESQGSQTKTIFANFVGVPQGRGGGIGGAILWRTDMFYSEEYDEIRANKSVRPSWRMFFSGHDVAVLMCGADIYGPYFHNRCEEARQRFSTAKQLFFEQIADGVEVEDAKFGVKQCNEWLRDLSVYANV